MKFRWLLFVLALTSMLVSACGAAASQRTVAPKVQAMSVAYTGVIEAINGNEWTINGKTLTVDPSVVRDGPFKVGDTVKVEAIVQLDGSLTVTRLETPSPEDLAASAGQETGSSSSAPNPSDGSAGGETEVVGTVESVGVDTVVVDGKTFTVTNATEFKDQILAGDFVKIHFIVNPDGTVTITEIEKADPTMDNNSGGNSGSGSNSGSSVSSGSDDGPNHDANDDHGGDDSGGDHSGGDDDHSGSEHD